MPLDIETVVEKYVALGSDATFVSNLRRHGIGPAGIEKALNQRRALRGDDADRVSQIEQFRSELSNKGRVGLIDSYVSLFGSHNKKSKPNLPLIRSCLRFRELRGRSTSITSRRSRPYQLRDCATSLVFHSASARPASTGE